MKKFIKTKTIKIFLFVVLLFAAGTTIAQVGIGTPTPNASAQLDVSSATRGFLPPRLTLVQRNAINSPAAGLIVWCKDCGASGETQVFNGASWTNLSGAPAAPTSVLIGTHKWMLRNLDVTTFRNGDTIKEVKDAAVWADAKTGPAWCYYDNNPANNDIYGKLYNRAAVEDPRGLAPAGLRIPTMNEFFTLWDYLTETPGPNAFVIVSNKMREVGTAHWIGDNSAATNESGFTGLPGGERNPDGSFTLLGSIGKFWSADGHEQYYKPTLVLVHGISLEYAGVNSILYPIGHFGPIGPSGGGEFFPEPSEYGFSVRCINETVTIGNQEWMQKNLDVTKYRNGDSIPEVENPAVWDTLTSGAWCYYGGSSTNGAVYGKLYNGYAVRDPRMLAPAGWHVPSDDEWNLLTIQLGGAGVAGNAIKEKGTVHWNNPNAGATNSSGFTALPGGKREKSIFQQMGAVGAWWTSTPNSAGYLWYREVNYYDPNIFRWSIGERNAFSVRCVRD